MTYAVKAYKGMGMEGGVARWYDKATRRDMPEFVQLAARIAALVPASATVLEVAPGPVSRSSLPGAASKYGRSMSAGASSRLRAVMLRRRGSRRGSSSAMLRLCRSATPLSTSLSVAPHSRISPNR